jgi:hypothetical protein
MSLLALYRQLRHAALLDQDAANEIVRAARPHAAALLGPSGSSPEALRVTAKRVHPAASKGGSLIPAWPVHGSDGSVTIEFVEDWGALLAGWRAAVGEPADMAVDIDALVESRERLWIGIANDVLQLFVPDPPAGTYSMVRHHALMLAAATLWLGSDRVSRWRAAYEMAARTFLTRSGGRPLWEAVESAEQGLTCLLEDRRGRADVEPVLAWLEADRAAASSYLEFLGAASLGVAALLKTAPDGADPTDWLRHLVQNEHRRADFNRAEVESFARRVEAA